MSKRNKYFLYFSFILIGLFIFACFSIIYSVIKLNQASAAERTGSTLGLVALFLYLVIVSIALVYAIRAYQNKSVLVAVVMVDDRGNKNPRSYRNSLIFAGIFVVFGIFFFLNSFGIISLTKILTTSINLVLTNVGLGIAAVSFYLYFYKPIPKEELDN